MDDWGVEVDDADAREVIARRVTGRAVADPEAIRALVADLQNHVGRAAAWIMPLLPRAVAALRRSRRMPYTLSPERQ